MRRRVILLLLTAVLLAACGSDDTEVSAGPVTTAPGASPPTLALAATTGVSVLVDGQGTPAADEPATVAYAFGPDLGVFAAVRPEASPLRAWSGGGVQPLDPDAGTTLVRLLDAAVLDGRPVALTAERMDRRPENTLERLVLTDLDTGERTTLVRRLAWESGHVAGRLLPDGDVIGLVSEEVQLSLVRWSAEDGQPVWDTPVGADTTFGLSLRDGQISLLHTNEQAGSSSVAVAAYDPETGAAGDFRQLAVVDPDDTVGDGLQCDEWVTASTLVCHQSEGPPVLLDGEQGTVTALSAADGAVATMDRAA